MDKNKIKYLIILLVSIIILVFLWFFLQKDSRDYKDLISKNLDKNSHYLNLENKNLNSVPDICSIFSWDFATLNNIWKINLSKNNIWKFDKSLACLTNLTEIDFSYNKLDSLDNFWKISSLRIINASNNKIAKAKLNWLKSLYELNLSFNKIDITTLLTNLKKLKNLFLQNNKISDISNLNSFKNLEIINLENNNISDLKWIGDLKKVTSLKLNWNKISPEIINKVNNFYSQQK